MTKPTKPIAPAKESPKPLALSGADEQAAQALHAMDSLIGDYCRDLAARGQKATAQVISQTASSAARHLAEYIKAKAKD